MGFAHVRGAVGSTASATSFSITLGAAPATGDIVLVGVALNNTVTAFSISDANSNSYTLTTNSPSTFQSGAGQVYLAYLISAPANASATINVTWTTTSTGAAGWADEFSVSAGTASFDKDAAANTGTAGTTINTPTISPTNTGSLLYSVASAGGSISAPTAGGTLGSWTGAAGAITSGDMSEYILSSASGSTAVDYTQSSGGWSAMAMAIKFTASAAFQPDEDFGLVGPPLITPPIYNLAQMMAMGISQYDEIMVPLFTGQPDEDYWTIWLIQPSVGNVTLFS